MFLPELAPCLETVQKDVFRWKDRTVVPAQVPGECRRYLSEGEAVQRMKPMEERNQWFLAIRVCNHGNS